MQLHSWYCEYCRVICQEYRDIYELHVLFPIGSSLLIFWKHALTASFTICLSTTFLCSPGGADDITRHEK